jgi:YVTN family beta-propeller protein
LRTHFNLLAAMTKLEQVKAMNRSLSLLCFLVLAFASAGADKPAVRLPSEPVSAPEVRKRSGLAPNENLLFNGWGATPAGHHVGIADIALKLVYAPDKARLVSVSAGYNKQGVTLLDPATREVTQFLPLAQSFNGLAFSKDGREFYVGGGSSGNLHVFKYSQGKAEHSQRINFAHDTNDVIFLAGIAVHPGTGKIYICDEANHELMVVNPETFAVENRIGVGQHPHSVAVGGDSRYVYVSNWGSRSISIIDTQRNHRVRDLTVGLRPNDLAVAPDGRLFVACSGDNSVHVIQTKTLEKPGDDPSPSRPLWAGAREIISTSLYPQSPEGSTPVGLAVSPDGKTLFVANADNNAVAVVDISNSLSDEVRRNRESVSVVEGFIPVGWYPTAVIVAPDNKTLIVANGKGLASRPNFPVAAPSPRKLQRGPQFDYIAHIFAGSLSFIDRPSGDQMVAYTEQVRKNSPYIPDEFYRAPLKSDTVIPDKVGQACPIKYVLYIIKENRTYDQVMGDFKDARGKAAGNGDPNLTIYGEDVTPNHHQIARDYVLLDNLYCNGDVSVDGHSWCDAAIATDYNQRSWIMSYSKHGKLFGNEEMETPSQGYLWDLCRRHGVSFRNYGEGAQRVPSANRGKWTGARDMDKVHWYIDDLKNAEATGAELPRFTIMSLGENHTKGATVGAFTPEACVASNDIGLGKIVEAASRSKFWKEMAIFVIEDDAQNGPDHVDAHRTVGLVISPYCKRATVDSTLYTTASMVRTIELILGLPPLTQYDAGATPMFNCFTKTARATPYKPVTPTIDVTAKNTPKTPFSKESARMDFREYDRAPEDELNRILWHLAKGMDTPYPTPIHRAIFTTPPTAN